MRIRVIQKPSTRSIDGIRLDRFEPGFQYEVGTTLGILFLAEGWAEPVVNEKPALVVPLDEMEHGADNRSTPVNLHREVCPPFLDYAVAADFRRRKGRRH